MCVSLCPLFKGLDGSEAEKVFTGIYQNGVWGRDSQGNGISGPGSALQNTEEYRNFLQSFLKEHNIRSVIDVGCGRWEFSRSIDWSGIQYTGYDVVKSVVEGDEAQFGTRTTRFLHGDALLIDLPEADLLLCKDVLHHLPNKDIALFIKQFPKFSYCLITNDVDPLTHTSTNPDIQCGGFRGLDLAKPPFCVLGTNVLRYRTEQNKEKVVFLVTARQ
jgi:SAM-dependent methyltransferase